MWVDAESGQVSLRREEQDASLHWRRDLGPISIVPYGLRLSVDLRLCRLGSCDRLVALSLGVGPSLRLNLVLRVDHRPGLRQLCQGHCSE